MAVTCWLGGHFPKRLGMAVTYTKTKSETYWNEHLIFNFPCCLLVDLCSAHPGGGWSGHRSQLLVWGDWFQGVVFVRRQKSEFLLQRVPQFLGLHHCPKHHGAHFTLCQVCENCLILVLFFLWLSSALVLKQNSWICKRFLWQWTWYKKRKIQCSRSVSWFCFRSIVFNSNLYFVDLPFSHCVLEHNHCHWRGNTV